MFGFADDAVMTTLKCKRISSSTAHTPTLGRLRITARTKKPRGSEGGRDATRRNPESKPPPPCSIMLSPITLSSRIPMVWLAGPETRWCEAGVVDWRARDTT